MSRFTVAMAIPLQGPGGLYGPSCELAARLAAERINAEGGILGREVVLRTIDAGARPCDIARELRAGARLGRIDAVTGWHISSVRESTGPALSGLVPYIATSADEGLMTPGVVHTGETPRDQVLPGLRWMRTHLGVRRVAILGSDYVWPRETALAVRAEASMLGIDIVDEQFTPYGCRDFRPSLNRLSATRPDCVFVLLVGRDAVLFNRQFARSGLDQFIVRFAPLTEENMLMASGAGATRDLYVAVSYVSSLQTTEALEFTTAYRARFGPLAPPLNTTAESCYEGLLALRSLSVAAGSTDARAILAAAEAGLTYEGPRGAVHLSDRGPSQRVFIARADGLEFEVLDELPRAR